MFMGLVDGDGYIEIGPQKQSNKSNNLHVQPKSTIRARLVIRLHNRDSALLNYLTDVLGVGSISSLDSNNQTRLIFSIGLGAITLGFPNHELEFLSLLFVPAIAVSRKDKTITTKKSDRKSKVDESTYTDMIV
jgi:hypothetical protein